MTNVLEANLALGFVILEDREDVVLLALDYDSKDKFEHLNYWTPRLFSKPNVDNDYSMHYDDTYCSL